ncbi:MAG: glycosyltransferase [Niabella sp.]
MLKEKDIIIVGQQPWDIEIGSNCKDIALELSKYNRVLYVNSALDRISRYRGRKDPKIQKRLNVIKGRENGLVKIKENLYNLYPDCLTESINWIRSTKIFDVLNRRNNTLFARSVKKAIQELAFKDFLLFNDNDMFRSYYLKELLQPALSVYYSRDNMVGVDYWKRHGLKLEPKLIEKSDLCTANSEYLADYCRKYNPNSFYVGQGCDLSLFDDKNLHIPDDIAHIDRPVIGYVGALWTSRLDLSLLENLAKKKTDWNWVFVGPEDESFQKSILHQLPNVHFMGARPPQKLPDYIYSFDVCINPQLINAITVGNYPRKIDEYLALGKPCIATDTPSMAVFKEYVYLATTEADYITGIGVLLDKNSAEQKRNRRNFALSHTWENCVLLIGNACLEVAAAKGIRF